MTPHHTTTALTAFGNIRNTPYLGRLLLVCALAIAPALAPAQAPTAAAAAGSPAEMFRRMTADNWIPRAITLAELGFTAPIVLGYPDSLRETYLPVPPGV
jgi:hypothetical protein